MPFADPERKREYQRAYKARLREAKVRAQSPPTRRVFFCSRFPSLKVGMVEFFNGFFVTSDPEKQHFIENLAEYGRYIISWPADPSPNNGNHDFIM